MKDYKELFESMRYCASIRDGSKCAECEYDMRTGGECVEGLLSEAADAIEELTKNKTGNWINKNSDGAWRVDTCSVCNTDTHYVRYAPSYKYCPNCGAKMKPPKGEEDAV